MTRTIEELGAKVEALEKKEAEHEKRIASLEKRANEKDTQFAVINTKLTAILWVLAAFGTATIGVIVKFLSNS